MQRIKLLSTKIYFTNIYKCKFINILSYISTREFTLFEIISITCISKTSLKLYKKESICITFLHKIQNSVPLNSINIIISQS